MKTSRVAIVAVAILLAVTGIGFGIAQAGGTNTDRPILSFEDQEALEQGSSSNPIETGSLPSEMNLEGVIVEIDGVSYYELNGKLYGP